MPCSGCGGSGHNIRTCAFGPTPGGVNGMRSRSSPSSNFGRVLELAVPRNNYSCDTGIVPYINFGSSNNDPFRSMNNQLSSNTLERFENIKRDIIKANEEKLSGIKELVDHVDDKFDKQFLKLQKKLDNQEKTLKLYKKDESASMNKLLAKIESDSEKNLEVMNKMMKEMEIAKRDTLKLIENKFNEITKKFAAVEEKTKENEANIKKHSQEIHEIKQLLVHVIENQGKQKPISKNHKAANFYDTDDSDL